MATAKRECVSGADVANYVRQNYTDKGVEVGGRGGIIGPSCVRLTMPPDFPYVTELSNELMHRFNAGINLVVNPESKDSVVFEVYTDVFTAYAADSDDDGDAPEVVSPADDKKEPESSSMPVYLLYTLFMPIAISVLWVFVYHFFVGNKPKIV